MSAAGDTRDAIVFICECGPILGELIDLDDLQTRATEGPGVAAVERYTTLCSPEGRKWLAERIRANPGLRPVIAACSPREHVDAFEEAAELAGVNPYLFGRANIREQVAWVTTDRADATAKAADLVGAAVARVARQVALEGIEVECSTSVLVVGAGVAGMTAATLLADSGRDVILVEREPMIGGRAALLGEIYPDMECAPCVLEPLMDKVLHHAQIEVLTSSEVEDVLGYLGNFTAVVRRHPRHVDIEGCYACDTCKGVCPVDTPDRYNAGLSTKKAVGIPVPGALPNASVVDESACLHFTGGDCDACQTACPFGCIDLGGTDELVERSVGAVVLTTGAEQTCDDVKETSCSLPSVMTTWEFERLLNPDGCTGGEVRIGDDLVPGAIALVHCADADGSAPAKRCSKTCCLALAKYGTELSHKLPGARVFEFMWDRNLGGPHYLAQTAAERPAGLTEIRMGDKDTLEVGPCPDGTGAKITYTRASDSRDLLVDLVVVATPHVGTPDGVRVARLLGADVGPDGYVLPEQGTLKSFASRVSGVFVAGSAAGEKDIAEASAQAAAAAGAVMSALVPGRSLTHEATYAVVEPDKCGACRLCVLSCPYKAVTFDEERRVAVVNELLCHGCGTCVAACPSVAIQARHFTDDQLLAEIGVLSRVNASGTGA